MKKRVVEVKIGKDEERRLREERRRRDDRNRLTFATKTSDSFRRVSGSQMSMTSSPHSGENSLTGSEEIDTTVEAERGRVANREEEEEEEDDGGDGEDEALECRRNGGKNDE